MGKWIARKKTPPEYGESPYKMDVLVDADRTEVAVSMVERKAASEPCQGEGKVALTGPMMVACQ